MDINALKTKWDRFGRKDPLWAICTESDKIGNKWDVAEFFQTGVKEIDSVMRHIQTLHIGIAKSKALDFGCGVGRLTQALATHFDHVCGVDIAPSMIKLANKHNRHGAKCKYYLNQTENLNLFGDESFSFIYSLIVLQHMEPWICKNYIKEFLRLLAPNGLLIFQLPSEQVHVNHDSRPSNTLMSEPPSRNRLWCAIKNMMPRPMLKLYLDFRYPEPPRMDMYGTKRKEMETFLKDNGATVIDVVPGNDAGPTWVSFRYFVSKRAP